MELLETYLSTRRNAAPCRFATGQLTIIDLSDIFVDPSTACGLFEIVTRLFVRTKLDTGKLLVVDEAHKVRVPVIPFPCISSSQRTQYLTPNGKRGSGLTRELSSLVRQQRHMGMRVIISTQGTISMHS